MHVPNHLVSPEAAIVGSVVAVALIGVAIAKVRTTTPRRTLSLVWAVGALLFASQMINIPIGTLGYSGHLVGGILAAALLGPWLGFLTLSGVIALQALLFTDGGLLALGWNIVNMAAIGALVVYPLIFRPIAKRSTTPMRYLLAAIAASVVAIVAGAAAVVGEAAVSGVAVGSLGEFFGSMLSTHAIISLLEGGITGAALALIAARQPSLLESFPHRRMNGLKQSAHRAVVTISLCALFIGGVLSTLASEHPDGLEWSIQNTLTTSQSQLHTDAEALQQKMALAPDYEGDYTGLLATAGILLCAWISTPSRRKQQQAKEQ